MKGIENIIEKIAGEAAAYAADTEAKARAEAGALRAEYAERARRVYDELVERGTEQAAEIEHRHRAVARLEQRKRILGKKQELISEAFSQAMARLRNLEDEDYADLLTRLAARHAISGREQIILSAADRARHGAHVAREANRLLQEAGRPAGLTLAEEARELGGGLVLRDGDVEINCTLSTIVHMLREELAPDVAATLFAAK